jgi:hypothetical protein
MPQGKRGKKRASLEMPEDSTPLEEDDIHVDPNEELEEATMDYCIIEEMLRGFLSPNDEIDFSEMIGIDQELSSFSRFHGSFETDDESERELFYAAGLKTTGLGPEDTYGVVCTAEATIPGLHEAKSIGFFESFDDGDAKETTETAGHKTTGLEPEQLSESVNIGEGAVGGWQEANPSTELLLGRHIPAPRHIPVQDVINHLRMQKEFDGLTDKQLAHVVYKGLSHKKPILPSTNSTLETRVQGTEKVPKRVSSKGTGKRRGPYKEQQRHAQTSTANGGESISISFKQEALPRFKETIRLVSQPQARSEDGKADSNTVKKPEGEKEVLSGLCVLSDSSRPLRLTHFFPIW